jgi:hypothetical protein
MTRQKHEFPEGDVIGSIPHIRFPENNEYRFLMDYGIFRNVPPNINFYPVHETGNGLMTFIGDGYGVRDEYTKKFGIAGNYGSGSISIYVDDIPHLLEWCRKNFLTLN